MARVVEHVLRDTVGSMVMQIASLTAQLEARDDHITALESQIAALQPPPEPDPDGVTH